MINNRTKIVIVLSFLFLASAVLSKNVFGSVVNTQNIIRQTPPTPPTPPTKPEPPTPPAPPVITPTPLPTPTSTPKSTPTPTPATPTEESNQGTGGAPFQLGGPPPPPSVTGQVLGVSTLGGTGVAEDNLFSLIFILGCLATSLGIRKIATAQA